MVREVEYARKLGARIIVLHVEGTWNDETAVSFYRRGVRLYDDSNPVELDLVWGKTMSDLLVKNTSLTENMVKIIGCPRFDVYKPPLNKLMLAKNELAERYNLSLTKPLIVWATNFVNVDRTERDLRYIEEFDDRDMHEENDIQRSLRSKHLDAFIQMVEDYPNCQFVIKTHPLEVPDFYEIELQQRDMRDKVVIIKDITIEHVLNSTSIYLNTNSTSSTEAWFLGIPTISLLFDERARRKLSAFASGNEMVIDYTQLKEVVDSVLSKTYKPTQAILNTREEFVKNWFFKIDGNSTQRAVLEIDLFVKGLSWDEDIKSVYSKEVFFEGLSHTFFYKIARKLFHKVKGTTSYWDKIRESDILHPGEIETLYRQVEQIYEEQESRGKNCTDSSE
jgi:surface carbohydrate biosynthesis protein